MKNLALKIASTSKTVASLFWFFCFPSILGLIALVVVVVPVLILQHFLNWNDQSVYFIIALFFLLGFTIGIQQAIPYFKDHLKTIDER